MRARPASRAVASAAQVPRFEDEKEGRGGRMCKTEVYNTDAGHKMSLARAVEHSPMDYSNMATATQRFK